MNSSFKKITSILCAVAMVCSVFAGLRFGTQSQTPPQAAADKGFYWPSFRGNDTHNAVVDFPMPRSADEAELYWAVKKGAEYEGGAIGAPIIVDDSLVFASGSSLFRQNRFTGEIDYETVGTLAGRSTFNIVSPAYGDGMIFVTLNNGILQAFDAETLESLWVYQDPLKGQGNTMISYRSGYVYTGYWNSETQDANFVCVDVTDEDPNSKLEAKTAKWVYASSGGFYWAGAYVCDQFLLVGTDDGQSGYSSGTADLLSLNPLTGEPIDKIEDLCSDIRSNVSFDAETNRYYFTSKSGSFYGVRVGTDGKFKKDENGIRGYDLKMLALRPMDDSKGMLTSTPAIANGRAYVGIGGANQFGLYSGHCIAVIDLDSFTLAYRARTKGYPQSSGLVTTAYAQEADDGCNYVYFPENCTPGIIRVLKDKKGVTEVLNKVREEYKDSRGVTQFAENCAPALLTPVSPQAQYALVSLIADPEGTIYLKNDSAHMMAVGSRNKRLTVTQSPQKTVYGAGEAFDPAGIKVTAMLANGLARDVSAAVKYSSAPLTLADTDVTLTYDIMLYHDNTNVGVNNSEGAVSIPLEAVVNVDVLSAQDKALMDGAEARIRAIGEAAFADKAAAIAAARAAYDALPAGLQGLVQNLAVLTDAEKHRYGAWITAKENDCTEPGIRMRLCVDCNKIDAEIIPAKGHKFSAWAVTKAASCKAAGVQTRSCSVCGKTETKSVAKLTAHKAGAWVTAVKATDTKAGKREQKCTVCGKVLASKTIPANHTVKLNRSSAAIGKGETLKLTAAASVKVGMTWTSSNTKAATVSSNGTVTAKGIGTANITVKTSGGRTAVCKVTVKNAPSAVSLNKTSMTLGKGETYTLKSAANSGAASLKYSWKSSNPKAVKVDASGKVTAVGIGKAVITVTTFNGKTKTCKVTVK